MLRDIELGHPKGTGVAAVLAVDTARLVRLMHHAIGADQDGLRRAHLRARGQRVLAVHAQGGRGGHGVGALDIIDVDHALALVGVAFAAGSDARAAPDAARGIEKDLFDGHRLSAIGFPFLSLGHAKAKRLAQGGR